MAATILRHRYHCRVSFCGCVTMAVLSAAVLLDGNLATSELSPNYTRELAAIYPPESPLILREVNANAFVPLCDGRLFVIANGRAEEVYNTLTGRRVLSMQHPEMVLGAAVAPDETRLATVIAGRTSPIFVWELPSGKCLGRYSWSRKYGDTAPHEGDGARGSDAPEWDFPIRPYRSQTGFGFTSVAFSETGEILVAGREEGVVVVYDSTTGRELAAMTGKAKRLWSIAISPDPSRALTCGGLDGTVQLWDLRTRRLVREYRNGASCMFDSASRVPFAFSGDRKRFAFQELITLPEAAGMRVSIHVCDAGTGRYVRTLTETIGQADQAFAASRWRCVDGCLAFVSCERIIVNTGSVLNLWDVPKGMIIGRYRWQSGVNRFYSGAAIEFVRYVPSIAAILALEVDNDENTLHQDWTIPSVVVIRD